MISAIISGRARTALLSGGRSFHFDGGVDHDIHFGQAVALLRDAPDQSLITASSESAVREQLRRAVDRAESLDLILLLLDSDLLDATRRCAASELDEAITETTVVEHLKQLLYARPLPLTADLDGAIHLSDATNSIKVFLVKLQQCQETIKLVRDAWEGVSLRQGRRSVSRRAAESVLLRHGVFNRLVDTLRAGEHLGNIQVAIGVDEALKKELPDIAHIMMAWVKPMKGEAHRHADNVDNLRPSHTANASDSRANDWHETPLSNSASRRTRVPRPIHPTWDEALDAAVAQVEKVSDLVRQGKDAQANQIRDQLVKEQRRNPKGDDHVVKSLCNIATKTRQVGRDDYAVDCLRHALSISSTDPIALFQLATLLRDFRKFDDASRAYDKAIEHTSPTDSWSLRKIHSAKAHIFTEQGKYDEALHAYHSIPFEDDPDPSIPTAIADVNRRKGNLSTAMSMYISLIGEYPWSDRAFVGKAEIAKRRGDPHRAIQLYNHVLKSDLFDLDWQSRSVYELATCRLLKMVGQHQKAFSIANAVAQREPFNLGAQLQLVSLLAVRGDASEGLSRLSAVSQGPDEWRVHYVRGLTLFRLGMIADAKKELLERIEFSQVLPEDASLVSLAKAFVHLADEKPSAALSLLEIVHPIDRTLKDLKQVFEVHASSIQDNVGQRRHYPRLRRSVRELRYAVRDIRDGDMSGAVAKELTFLLLAA